jgi:hypothetical protein
MASPGSDLIDTNKQIARTTAVQPLLLARSVTGRRSVAGHRSCFGNSSSVSIGDASTVPATRRRQG